VKLQRQPQAAQKVEAENPINSRGLGERMAKYWKIPANAAKRSQLLQTDSRHSLDGAGSG